MNGSNAPANLPAVRRRSILLKAIGDIILKQPLELINDPRTWIGVLLCANALSIMQGCLILLNGAILQVTPLKVLSDVCWQNPWIMCLVLLASGFAGLHSIISDKPIFLIPQHAIMLMAAFSSLAAIISGQYPDGYVPLYAWKFIAADQMRLVIDVVGYSLGIFSSWRWGTE